MSLIPKPLSRSNKGNEPQWKLLSQGKNKGLCPDFGNDDGQALFISHSTEIEGRIPTRSLS